VFGLSCRWFDSFRLNPEFPKSGHHFSASAFTNAPSASGVCLSLPLLRDCKKKRQDLSDQATIKALGARNRLVGGLMSYAPVGDDIGCGVAQYADCM
jgi:hypothetical protein